MLWRQVGVAVLLGCSGPTSAVPPQDGQDGQDGGGSDSSDASLPVTADCDPTAAPGPVRVFKDFRATTLVHDLYGNLVERIDPDSAEAIDVMVPGCGSVTTVVEQGLRTITSVSAGDELFTFRRFNEFNDGRVIIDAAVPGALTYGAEFGDCSGVANPSIPVDLRVSFPDFCNTSGQTSILVMPFFPEPDLIYAVVEDVDLSTTLQSPPHITEWLTDAPLHRFSLELNTEQTRADCYSQSIAHGHSYRGLYVDDGISSMTHTLDARYPEFGSGAAFTCRWTAEGHHHQRSFTRHLAGAIPAEVHIGEDELLPVVSSPTLTGNTLSWSTTPDVGMEDAVLLGIRGVGIWTILVPGGVRTFRLPAIPPDLATPMDGFERLSAALGEATDMTYRDARNGLGLFAIFAGGDFHDGPMVLRTSLSESAF